MEEVEVGVAHAGLLWRFAREMRANPTPAEHLLWQQLRATQLGVRFDQQFVLGPYIVDFVCRALRLVVEVDGGVHHLPEAIAYDAERSSALAEVGYRVLRFRNEEVIANAAAVAAAIQAVVAELTKRNE